MKIALLLFAAGALSAIAGVYVLAGLGWSLLACGAAAWLFGYAVVRGVAGG